MRLPAETSASTAVSPPLTLESLEAAIRAIPPEPFAELMREQGFDPETSTLLLPKDMHEGCLPDYVVAHPLVKRPTLVRARIRSAEPFRWAPLDPYIDGVVPTPLTESERKFGIADEWTFFEVRAFYRATGAQAFHTRNTGTVPRDMEIAAALSREDIGRVEWRRADSNWQDVPLAEWPTPPAPAPQAVPPTE